MTDQRDDKEFAAFLAGESELADRYQALGSEQPPVELDEHILAAARDAAKVHRLEFGPPGGWLKPVALAATVLLSFSLVMKIGVDSPVRYEQVVTVSKESDSTLEGQSEPVFYEQLARSLPQRTLEMKNMREEQQSEQVIEEVTVTGRSRSIELKDAPMAVSILGSAEQSIDQDAALLIVAEYVAMLKTKSDSGRFRLQEMERSNESTAKEPALTASSPVASKKDWESIDKLQTEDDSESMLREIVRLYTSGSNNEAGTRLDEFLAHYPDHPVSVKLRRRGY
ncbi:MAG: hypothetical protein QGH93_09055 [Gammaproteobacteria bacterium]|nr:hypothetical protein [Chromatiales bacterium]MDP6674977.1 hypothetical protein [Gammaproteobacteria bacterium]